MRIVFLDELADSRKILVVSATKLQNAEGQDVLGRTHTASAAMERPDSG